MASRAVPPQWRRRIEARLNALEERIRREIRAERESREVDSAHTDEEIEALEVRLDGVKDDQDTLMRRLRWLEARLGAPGRPPKPKKN